MKNKTVNITGGTLDLTEISELQLLGNLTFKNTKLVVNGNSIYANGNELIVSNDVDFEGIVAAIYGGGKESATWSTNLTLLAGNYKQIYGGSNGGVVLGNTNVVVGGVVNVNNTDLDLSDPNHPDARVYNVYGGGLESIVAGDTHVTIQKDAQTSVVYGGGKGDNSKVNGTCYVNVNGGKVMGYYGGNCEGSDTAVKHTVITMTDGKTEQIFGGSDRQSMALAGSTVNVTITGGTITRRIYGGCYNDAEQDGLSVNWKSSHHINGNIYLAIGPNANIDYSSTSHDRGVFGGSRYKSGFSDEKVTLILLDGCKDVSGRDSSDWGGSFLGSPKKYDSLERK